MDFETTFDGANRNYGSMFDISSPEGDRIVTIEELDIHVNFVTRIVRCYLLWTRGNSCSDFDGEFSANWKALFQYQRK
jgi:hypothetical protein